MIVGIGNLGHALANYAGFASRGFRVAALVDADPARAGTEVAGLTVRHVDELEQLIADRASRLESSPPRHRRPASL